MTERRKFRSVAVPMDVWKQLWAIARVNKRSPAQQIAFLVEAAKSIPSDNKILERYAALLKKGKKYGKV